MKQTLQEKKDKARWARILKLYGLTKEQYDELDKGFCPICLRSWGNTVRPACDHDHSTGLVRGIVCLYCNRYRIGRFRDANLVQRIADYLRQPSTGYIIPPKPKKKRKRKSKKILTS